VRVEIWGSFNLVKGCKYLLLLVILPFIWLNQSGLDRINDQKNDQLNDQEKDQTSDRINDQKKTLVMTLPPIHQYQTETIRPVRKFVKTLLVIVGVAQSLHLRWFSTFDVRLMVQQPVAEPTRVWHFRHK